MKKEEQKEEKTESVYEIKGKLRFVKSYKHDFKTFAKRRWVGEKLIDVFTSEFKAFSSTYYVDAIGKSKITVNDKAVSTKYLIKEGDKIVYSTVKRFQSLLKYHQSYMRVTPLLHSINHVLCLYMHVGTSTTIPCRRSAKQSTATKSS